MKKLFLGVIALLAASSATFAQSTSPVTFGIKGGLNLAKLTVSGNGNSASTGTLTSFHAGVFADVPVAESFSIQPALLYSQLGTKESEGSASEKITLNYLQLPVNAVYHVPAGAGKFFIGAGPFVGYALSGKDKVSGTDGQDGSADLNFGDGGFKRINFGLGSMVGYKLTNGFLLSAGYDFGLSSIVDAEGGSIKTNNFAISVGYSF